MKEEQLCIEGFYSILPLRAFRRTPGVEFHVLEQEHIPRVDGVDRVIHHSDAQSPGPVGDVKRPWYMHLHQDDHLIVLMGLRRVELFHLPSKQLVHFAVSPEAVHREGVEIFPEPAILAWPRGVFHRIISGSQGSASLNLASRYDGFDISNNFSIYRLDTESGAYESIRRGELDQRG